MVLEVRQGPVEAVRRVRAAHTARLRPAVDRRAEHEVVDEQLRAPVEELGEGLRAFVGLEAVVLVDTHPRKVSPLARQLVTAARERRDPPWVRVARDYRFEPNAGTQT